MPRWKRPTIPRKGSSTLPTVAATTWRLAVQPEMRGLRARTCTPSWRGWRSRCRRDSAAASAGGLGGRVRVLLPGDGRPADAEVDHHVRVVEAVEDLEGEVGHLLQPHGPGGPVLAPQLEQQPALGSGRRSARPAGAGR